MGMIEQILLSSGSFDGVRETGGFGQPLHALYPQIQAILASEIEPDAAFLLAEPVVDRARNRIDWYTEGDPDHPPVALGELPDEQRRSIQTRVEDLLSRGRELAARYAAADDSRRARLGAVLRAVLINPAETEVFLVSGRPVMTGWGFAPDRPWEMPDGSAGRPPSPVETAGPARDVLVPEVDIPDLATIAPDATPRMESPPVQAARQAEAPPPLVQSAPVGTEPQAEALLPPSPTREQSAPSPEPLPSEPLGTAPPQLESEPPLKSQPGPAQAGVDSPPAESLPPSRLRYVVVGSHYFWSVVLIAVLLVLFAAYWTLGRGWLPLAGEITPAAVDVELERALTEAQGVETGLRARLERLLAQLAERRGRCVLPTGSDAAISSPTPGGMAGTVGEGGVLAGRGEATPTILAGTAGKREPAAPPLATDRQEAPSAPPAQKPAGVPETRDVPIEALPPDIVASKRPSPPPPQSPPADVLRPADVAASPSIRSAETPSPAEAAPPGRTLEETLTQAGAAPGAPSRRQSPAEPSVRVEPPTESLAKSESTVKPPVKSEPTAEERREFANRMSERGAMTGEITVTLLWNGQSDLDLVVRCPSGRQLDFRNPTECDGALDVDANATRGGLNDRPVENAFWPAGKARRGAYEVAVRYFPRKDEERLVETPFQVRVSRGGQESVFKGAIRPNTVTPVTTFTVGR